jgi:hypothetical protein
MGDMQQTLIVTVHLVQRVSVVLSNNFLPSAHCINYYRLQFVADNPEYDALKNFVVRLGVYYSKVCEDNC